MPPLIIGLAGKARHGKDTIAGRLCREHGFTKLAFADPILDMIELGLGVDRHYLTEKEEVIPAIGRSYRYLAQTLGTSWGREMVRSDLWVRLMQQRIDRLADEADRIVISDVRFHDEAEFVRRVGHLWHVRRPLAPTIGTPSHVSEAGIVRAADETLIVNNENAFFGLFNTIDRRASELLEAASCR